MTAGQNETSLPLFPEEEGRNPEPPGPLPVGADPVQARADELLSERVRRVSAETDRRFAGLMVAQWLLAIVLAVVVSPRAWAGQGADENWPWRTAVFLGGLLAAGPVLLAWRRPGWWATRHTVAVAQMLFSALFIGLTGGRIETHFHIFGSLAFLAFYRDGRVLFTATVVVVTDHVLRGHFLPRTIFGEGYSAGDPNLAFHIAEHTGWVAFEVVFLMFSLRWSRREMRASAEGQARLEALNGEIARAKQEADTIMAAVSEGLFLLDPAGRIGQHHSRALETIFGRESLAGESLLDLLRPTLPERTWESARDYLDLLFDPKRKEAQLARVNPLAAVEIQLPGAPATAEESGGGLPAESRVRHLEFSFRRVLADGGRSPRRRVTHLLVAVADVTGRVNLERQLRRNEEVKQKEIELLFSILHVDPMLLREFMEASTAALAELNAALRGEGAVPATDNEAALREKLAGALRSIHALKGNAAMLRLGYFENKAHALEDEINALQERPSLTGLDLLPLVLKQAEVQRDLGELRALVRRLLQFQISFTACPGTNPARSAATAAVAAALAPGAAGPLTLEADAGTVPADPLLASVSDYVRELGDRLGRPATLFYDDFVNAEVPARYAGLLRDVLLQFARNSLTHGLEDPAERADARKPPHGRLQLLRPRRRAGLKDDPGTNPLFEFVFRDDGRGLQLDRLRAKAVERGDATESEAAAWPPEQLAALIFEPGLSTADDITGEAGRGIGMDVVKTRVVDEHGGEIRVHSMPGQHTTFHVLLPGAALRAE